MSIAKKGREFLTKYPALIGIISVIYNRTVGFNKVKIKGKNNEIIGLKKSFLRKSKIKVVGQGNSIKIDYLSFLDNCSIFINGDNNKIIIGKDVYAFKGDLYIEDNNNSIIIGNSTAIRGYTHIAVTEGTQAIIGKDCLFSSDVTIRTGDSHSIIDSSGKRINPAIDVYIGDHTWVGNKTTILKGSIINSNSIVGTGSIVTKRFEKENIIVAGNPAKVVKENVSWLAERVD